MTSTRGAIKHVKSFFVVATGDWRVSQASLSQWFIGSLINVGYVRVERFKYLMKDS